MVIFQTYYADDHKQHLLPNTSHLDTRGLNIPWLEYDLFKILRPEGDFGMVSWKFARKTQLADWEDRVREKLKTHDAVIINPFPAISAVSYNCWQTHPSLVRVAQDLVDVDVFQEDMAFCSYIFAKKGWWDRYFEFMEKHLQDSRLNQSGKYSRNGSIPMAPFIIERLLNYCLEGAYLWEYDREHHMKKFGTDEYYNLRKLKTDFNAWAEKAKHYDIFKVASIDDV